MTDHMQQLLDSKTEQLEIAIDKYNNQSQSLLSQKKEYDNLMQKARIEMREVERMKKLQGTELEKMRELDMKKIKDEKRALD